MSSPVVTFNLTCGEGVTELKNLATLRLSSFAESHQMQQKNFDVAPNSYATDALITYEQAVTDRVLNGQHQDWSPADPECITLHLGPDSTYGNQQGGHRWSRQSSGGLRGSRDFSNWPKEICWF